MTTRISALLLLLCVCAPAYAQRPVEPAAPAKTASAPAPRRDINGVWNGAAAMRLEAFPPMTQAGQQAFDEAKPFFGPRAVPVALSNHGLVTCDPLGFPQNVFFELREVEFQQVSNRMLQLFQYQRTFRDIWTDGRKLPAVVGGDTPGSADPRWYGYSVGRWDDDYTFVVNSTGFNDKSWATAQGNPRSMDARIEERYRRIDRDTLEITVTIDDPKTYTKPFVAMRQQLRRDPKQELDEQLCVPSEALEYLDTFKGVAEPKP
jgi:hypothetical protein